MPFRYEYEAGMYEAGGRRFEKIVRFADGRLCQSWLLIKNKGTWVHFSDGEYAYKRISDPEAFYREAIKRYRNGARSGRVSIRAD